MHTIFDGGMSQFYLGYYNTLTEDTDVPFGKAISKVTRLNDGTMEETTLINKEITLILNNYSGTLFSKPNCRNYLNKQKEPT